MSWVTNIILHISAAEEADERISEVNRFFERMPHAVTGEEEPAEPLASVAPVWEGKGHSLEAYLYVGAYNYFPLDRFMQHLRGIEWEEPDYIQVFVQDQEEMEFRGFKLADTPLEAEE